tara:strand:- start:316 stop:1608 length:1293 start_codon:yes stop_codon:yes gene_type:complete
MMNKGHEQFLAIAEEITRRYKMRYWAASDAVCKGTPPPMPPPPTPPATPSLAEVTTETVRLLPTQKRIEMAARMGERVEYADPVTGETRIADFRGMGDADLSRKIYDFQRSTSPEVARDLLSLQKELGTDFVAQRRKELEASDPEAFRARQQLGQQLLTERMSDADIPDIGSAEQVSDITLRDEPLTAAGRAKLEETVYDNITRGLAPAMLRRHQQAERARGAAVGNVLGDSAALRESLSVQMAEENQKSAALGQALSLLQSGQTTSDTANRLRQANLANRMSTVGQRSAARQQDFANQMQRTGYRQGLRQQDISNLQGYVFGQPLTAQFGMLQGAQGGASPYAPLTPAGGMGMAGQLAQGAGFASDVFGTQANIFGTQGSLWNTQAGLYQNAMNNRSNPWMTAIGFAGSAFGGPMLSKGGSLVGKKLFG